MNIPIEIIVSFLGFVFTAISGVTIFFVKAMNNNTNAMNGTRDAIVEIKIWMSKKDTEDDFENKDCISKHDSINKKFNEHGKRIDNHEHRLIKLEK